MKLNTKAEKEKVYTAPGAEAQRLNPELRLRRSVMANMLWEGLFYEEGISVADRISEVIPLVDPEKVKAIAVEARSKMNLRHVPLLIACEMLKSPKHRALVADTLAEIIQRPDELTEFLAIYWRKKRTPIAAQVKKGLARAFRKFDEYQLAKYNRDDAIKLRDVLFLCHAKPKDKDQEALWKRLVEEKLVTPDTWEVALSSGADKKAAWERLLAERKLGGMALLRNLRNMEEAEVPQAAIRSALADMRKDRIFPFRFIAAAKAAPRVEDAVEKAMLESLSQAPKLVGKTVMVVDVSGSMYGGHVSRRSEMTRAHAACALAMVVRERCENPAIYATAGNDGTEVHDTKLVPARRGFALADAIFGMCRPLGGGGIFLSQVMDFIKGIEKDADRIVVITDEQDCDHDPERSPLGADAFGKQNYLINVSVEKNGIGYGKWTHIDGWSEAILDYIQASETVEQQ